MSLVNVINMLVLDNPTFFSSPFSFEITFECFENLEEDLEWKVIYVVKPEDMSSDIVLEHVLVGPVSMGVHTFLLQAEAPFVRQDHETTTRTMMTTTMILGVTALLVTCSYRDQEFCRIGYYVNNEWNGNNHELDHDHPQQQQQEEEQDASTFVLHEVVRTILADKPRVTRFPIQWHDTTRTMTTTTTIPTTTTMEYTPMKCDTTTTTTSIMETPPSQPLPMVVSPPPSYPDMQL